MPPRDLREYISPLLQPPLNRLFVPRPLPSFIPSLEKGMDGYTGPRVDPIQLHQIETFRGEQPEYHPTESLIERKRKRVKFGLCLDLYFHLVE